MRRASARRISASGPQRRGLPGPAIRLGPTPACRYRKPRLMAARTNRSIVVIHAPLKLAPSAAANSFGAVNLRKTTTEAAADGSEANRHLQADARTAGVDCCGHPPPTLAPPSSGNIRFVSTTAEPY